MLYKPFPYSDHLALHEMDQKEGSDFSFRNVHLIASEGDVQSKASSSLFICPYFPETRGEYEWCNLYWLPFFKVDWEDPGFRAEVARCLTPQEAVKTVKLPSNYITVAVHIRRGREAHLPGYIQTWPLKFMPDSYYIEQIQRLANIFAPQKLYVFIFTDDENPSQVVEKYKTALNNSKIRFDYQKGNPQNSLFKDFFSIPKFDCCILCQSNFSVIASKLGNYAVSISPVHCEMRDGEPIIDEIDLVFNGQN